MKILIDNQRPEYHKIINIESPSNANIYDDVDTILNALRACGYDDESIFCAFRDIFVEMGYVDISDDIDDDLEELR